MLIIAKIDAAKSRFNAVLMINYWICPKWKNECGSNHGITLWKSFFCVEKEENTGYQYFIRFLQCFIKINLSRGR